MIRKFRKCLAVVVGCICVAVISGCASPGPSGQVTSEASTQPDPLPQKSVLKLEELQPPVTAESKDVPPLPERAIQPAKEAQQHLAKGDYVKAIALLSGRVSGFAPDHPRVHRMLGIAYARLPNPGKAVTHLTAATNAASDDLEAQLLLGTFLQRGKDTDKATICFRTALKCSQAQDSNPMTGEVLLHLGDLLVSQGYWQAGLECYTKLDENIAKYARDYAARPALRQIVLRPHIVFKKRAEVLMKLRRYGEAVQAYQDAYQRDRSDPEIAAGLAEALIEAGQFEQVRKVLVDLAASSSQRKRLPALAGKACRASGNPQMPESLWNEFQAKQRGYGDLAVELARVAQDLGQPDQAQRILLSVLQKDPGDIAVARFLVGIQIQKGQISKAMQQIATVLAAQPDQIQTFESDLTALAKVENADKQFSEYVSSIEQQPKKLQAPMYWLAGRWKELLAEQSRAAELYAKCLQIDGEFFPAYHSLARLYAKDKQWTKLSELSSQLDKIQGNKHELYYTRGLVQSLNRDYAAAFASLRKAISLNRSDPATLELLGDALIAVGQPERAANVYNAARRHAPDDLSLIRKLFAAYLSAKSYGRAEQLCLSILNKDPQSYDAKVMLARVLMDSKKLYQAKQLIGELEKTSADRLEVRLLVLQLMLADKPALMFKKDFDQVTGKLNKIIDKAPDDLLAREVLATVCVRNGQYQKAAEAWAGKLARKPEPDTRKKYAAVLIEAEQSQEAIKQLEVCLKDDPQDQFVLTGLVKLLISTKQYDKAEEFFDQQIKQCKDPNQAKVLRSRKQGLLLEAKRFDKLQKLLDDEIAMEGADAWRIKELKVYAYGKADQHDKAVAYARSWFKEEPQSLDAVISLAEALGEIKQFDEAHKLLEQYSAKVIPQQGTDRDRAYSLAAARIRLYVDARAFDDLDGYSEAALKENSKNPFFRQSVVEIMLAEECFREALALVDGWIARLALPATSQPASLPASQPATQPAFQPGNQVQIPAKEREEALRSCYALAVQCLMRQKKFSQAENRATKYLRQYPSNVGLLQLRSLCYSELGRPADALRDLEAVYKKAPKNHGFNNNLGYQLADMGLQLPRAERMIRYALSQDPLGGASDIPPLDSLGWVLYKQGKFNESGQVFLKVIRMAGENGYPHPILFDHAGDVYYRLGWTQWAARMYRQALEHAKDQKWDAYDTRWVKKNTPAKLEAIRQGKPVEVAPLGKGVTIKAEAK